jgi:hypothetical protein
MAATPPATHKAMITLAAPMDRRSDTLSAVSLLDIGFLPVARDDLEDVRDCHLGCRYRKHQYRLLEIPVLRVIELKDTFATLLWAIVDHREDAAPDRGIRTAVVKWRQLARGKTDVPGSEMARRAGRSVLLFGARYRGHSDGLRTRGVRRQHAPRQGLHVLQTKCHDDSADKFLCAVTFISKSDPAERLYFDIVAVARAGDGWELKSGLCKR